MERTPRAKVSERDVWELQVWVTEEQLSMQGGGGSDALATGRGRFDPYGFCHGIGALSCYCTFPRWGMAWSYQCLERSCFSQP